MALAVQAAAAHDRNYRINTDVAREQECARADPYGRSRLSTASACTNPPDSEPVRQIDPYQAALLAQRIGRLSRALQLRRSRRAQTLRACGSTLTLWCQSSPRRNDLGNIRPGFSRDIVDGN